MRILFVTAKGRPITGASIYARLVIEHVLPAVDGAVYAKPRDLDDRWDAIHVLDGKRIPRPVWKRGGDNLILDVHDHYWCSPPDFPAPDRALRLLAQKIRKRHFEKVLGRAGRVIVHSDAVAAALSHRSVLKVNLGVPIPSGRRAEEKKRHAILLAGRDLFRKGVVPLFDALRIALDAVPSLELLLAGKEYPHALAGAKLLSAHLPVRFLGERTPEEMDTLYEEVAGVVLPSWIEAFGMTILEAMARRVPVIATDCGGPAEVVRHRVTGQLVPPGDSRALAEAMVTLFREKRLVASWAEAGRDLVARRHSIDAMVSGMIEAYC